MRAALFLALFFIAHSAFALKTKQVVYGGFDTIAVLQDDGSVQVHEDHFNPGEFAPVKDQLQSGVISLVSNGYMGFAALKQDGTVVSWGGDDADASKVQSQLHGIVKIVGDERAFAALRNDGAIVTWGWSGAGGTDSTESPELFSGTGEDGPFKDVFSVDMTFYATHTSGKLLEFGWNSGSRNPTDFFNVKKAVGFGNSARAILTEDGTMFQDGWITSDDHSQPSRNDQTMLSDVVDVVTSNDAFAVLKKDGSVFSWGLKSDDEAFSQVASLLSANVVSLVASNMGGFAALKSDGSVVCWTHRGSYVAIKSGATKLKANVGAFAAIMSDGSVKAWGDPKFGGVMSRDAELAFRWQVATDLYSTRDSFIALTASGAAVPWGAYGGGQPSREQWPLLAKDVASIEAVETSWGNFILRKSDNSIVVLGLCWGLLRDLLN